MDLDPARRAPASPAPTPTGASAVAIGPGARVAFVGLGVMGRGMVSNLLRAGYAVTVFSRSMAKATDAVAAGAMPAASVADAVRTADAVVTIVGFPTDVRAVVLGPDGVVAHAPPGSLVVDMTTSEPALAVEIARAARARGIDALDAPVSGGDVGARAGTLSIMVGGDPAAFDRARPLLAAMGKTIVHQGPPGSGQHAKLCNQIVIASTMIGVMEGLLYARRAGLDPDTVLASIGAGAAGSWTLSNLYPRAVRGDDAPGFYVRHFLKDIRIALAEAEQMGLRLPGLALAEQLYQDLVDQGGAMLGTQALHRVLEAASPPTAPA